MGAIEFFEMVIDTQHFKTSAKCAGSILYVVLIAITSVYVEHVLQGKLLDESIGQMQRIM